MLQKIVHTQLTGEIFILNSSVNLHCVNFAKFAAAGRDVQDPNRQLRKLDLLQSANHRPVNKRHSEYPQREEFLGNGGRIRIYIRDNKQVQGLW